MGLLHILRDTAWYEGDRGRNTTDQVVLYQGNDRIIIPYPLLQGKMSGMLP